MMMSSGGTTCFGDRRSGQGGRKKTRTLAGKNKVSKKAFQARGSNTESLATAWAGLGKGTECVGTGLEGRGTVANGDNGLEGGMHLRCWRAEEVKERR